MNEKFVEHLIVFILVYEINWWNKTFSILIFLGNIRQAKKKKDQSNDENEISPIFNGIARWLQLMFALDTIRRLEVKLK